MSFDDHKRFRDGLPAAPVFNGVYSLELIQKESQERLAIIATIQNPAELGVKILEYVEVLAPTLGALAGPQGIAIGAVVGKLSGLGRRILASREVSAEDRKLIPELFGEIVGLFKKNRAETDPTPEEPTGDDAASTAAAAVAAIAGHHVHAPHHGPDEELPPGHHDTSKKKH